MQNLRQYGVSVMTATDVVDDFCLAQGNYREAYILQAYRNLRWAWKELSRETLWEIKKVVLCLDCHKDTIHLPDDCERVLNLSVVDCYGKLHPLGFNTDYNTAEIRCPKVKCSCGNCGGEDTLCGAIDAIGVMTETVVINDTNYTRTILTRYDGSGAVQQQITSPAWDVAAQKVVYNVEIKLLCNVETTDKGCIAVTRPNMDALRNFCGVGNFLNQWDSMGFQWGNQRAYFETIPSSRNYWGEWNYNAKDRQIIHVFGHGSQTHFGNNEEQEGHWRESIRQVIVSYQTNGESPGQEILVPEYAVIPVQVGMTYHQKLLSPKSSEADKTMAMRSFNAQKARVFRYLNPIRQKDVSLLQTAPHRW